MRSNLIVAGKDLLIPIAASAEQSYALSDENRLEKQHETLAKKTGADPIIHTVKTGDTLWDLSQKYEVSVRRLAKWNGMAPGDMLQPGKALKLFIPLSNQPAATHVAAAPKRPDIVRKVNHSLASRVNSTPRSLNLSNGTNLSQRRNTFTPVIA